MTQVLLTSWPALQHHIDAKDTLHLELHSTSSEPLIPLAAFA